MPAQHLDCVNSRSYLCGHDVPHTLLYEGNDTLLYEGNRMKMHQTRE